MADESNLNGLAGVVNSSAGSNASASRKYANDMITNYWSRAVAMSAQIKKNMEDAAQAAKSIGSVTAIDLRGFDQPMGLGKSSGNGMQKATFSTNSSGTTIPLSQSRAVSQWSGGGPVAMRSSGGSIMPYGNSEAMGSMGGGQRSLPGGYAGWRTSVMPYSGGGAMSPYGGGGGGIVPTGGGGGGGGGGTGMTDASASGNSMGWLTKRNIMGIGLGVAGAAAAYGGSQTANVMNRNALATSFASANNSMSVAQFSGGAFGSSPSSTGTSDMLQGLSNLTGLGYNAGSAGFANLQKQMQALSLQTGSGDTSASGMMLNLQSGQVQNRFRAMTGIQINDSNGNLKSVNTIAKQLMGRLLPGNVTSDQTAFALRQGGSLDTALNSLGLDPDTQQAIAASMKAQSVGGGGVSSLGASTFRSAAGKAGSGEKIGADAQTGAVATMNAWNDGVTKFVGAVDTLIQKLGLGPATGATTNLLSHASGPLGVYAGVKLAKRLFKSGKSGVGSVVKDAESFVEGDGAATAAKTGAKIGAERFVPLGLGSEQTGNINLGTGWMGLGGNWHTNMPGPKDSGTFYNSSTASSGVKFSPTNPLSAAFTGSDGAGQSTGGGGGPSAAKSGPSGSNVIAIARKYLGTPYVWGGDEPGGFDCSGLVKHVYQQLGISLPRTAAEQAHVGKSIGSLSQAIPGDLLFWFKAGSSKAHHVAIYIGNGMMIAAPHTGTEVSVQRVYGNPTIRRVLGNTSITGDKNSNSLDGTGSTSASSGSSQMVGSAIASMLSDALSVSSTGVSGSGATAGDTIAQGLAGGAGGGGGGGFGSGGGGGTIGLGTGGGASTAAAPSNPSGNAALVRRLAAAYGWDKGAEWNALYATVAEESGFNNNNQNKSSTAYGMFQFLNSTWGDTGYSKTSDPTIQTEAGLKYIKNRYGDPVKEWAFHKQHNYYAKGSFEIEQDEYARLHAGEMVVPKKQADAIRMSMKGGSGGNGGSVVINIYPRSIDAATMNTVIKQVKAAAGDDSLTTALRST